MDLIAEYTNGNTTVKILDDGTKVREYDSNPVVVHPESIDVKITNYCDNGCKYCHEMSTTKGMHGDLVKLLGVVSELPPGVELAIGGGNPLSHPDLTTFFVELKRRGIISNITINQSHILKHNELITYLISEELVHGVGISVVNGDFNHIIPLLRLTDNIVFHLIAGVTDIKMVDKLLELEKCKILILGYKKFGFGVDYFSEEVSNNLCRWKKLLRGYIGRCTISFDNLAIEQLSVRKLFTTEGWERFYMGDDFCYTMYIDAVEQMYAPTSRSDDRKTFGDMTLLDYFKTSRNVG